MSTKKAPAKSTTATKAKDLKPKKDAKGGIVVHERKGKGN